MRVKDWENRLQDVIKAHQNNDEYSRFNCYTLADDVVHAVTGKRIHKAYKGGKGPKTEAGWAKLMIKNGFKSIDDIYSSKFEPRAVAMAQRGDIGLIEVNGVVSTGIFTTIGFMIRDLEGVKFVDPMRAYKAFEVK